MTLFRQVTIGFLAAFILSACAGSPEKKRQARDDFTYLDIQSFEVLTLQEEAKKEFYSGYHIPSGEYSGSVGHDVDIRPPQQVLELIPGARSEVKDGFVTLWLSEETMDGVWQVVQEVIDSRHIPLEKRDKDHIETGWVEWASGDEESLNEARYRVEKIEENNRHGFRISLIDWRENGVDKEISRTNQERYNVFMTNVVTSTYDQKLRAESNRKALQLVKQIPVSMGKDRSGLPVIIARAQYNIFWPRITAILPRLGFVLEERNQSQGLIKAKYSSPDNEFWESVGTKPLTLESKTYTFLLGDLGNRTSINITDSTGKPVTAEVLESIVPVLVTIMENDASLEK